MNKRRPESPQAASLRERAEKSPRNLRAAAEQSANTVAITDIRGNIEYVNLSSV
jgi:hypothetical protein